MIDQERAAALADEIKRNSFTAGGGVSLVRTLLLNEAISLLAEQPVPSPAPTDLWEVVNTAIFHAQAGVNRKDPGIAALSAISAAGYVILPREPTPVDRPLTARDLSDAFGCMWNAALSAARQNQSGFEFASILAEGFGAMAVRLNEIAEEQDRAALTVKEITP